MEVDGRSFLILVFRLANGCFISVSEGTLPRIGSLNVSLHSSMGVNTAKVIPSKYDSVFLNIISERVAGLVNGICIVSLHTTNALDLKAMKSLMESVLNVLGVSDGST